ALYARGHRLIADDIVAIDLHDPALPRVIPGYPLFKLWPESVASLGLQPDSLPRLRDDADKLGWDAHQHFESTPLPLRCIYSLLSAAQIHIQPITHQDVFLEILRYLYVSRFPGEFSDPQTSARNFRDTALVARAAAVRYLLRPPDLSSLGEIAQMIERDLDTLASPDSASPLS
ncbi:MAG: hypothetical protein K8J31_19160, partial [Anaerolineae bacterium]|nr:hypothetical protein [Anaerolineae bacterium]